MLVAVAGGLVARPSAEADHATGGTGLYRDTIGWFVWGTHGEGIPSGTVRTNTRTINGLPLVTTCTLSNLVGGWPYAYRSGNWTGDGLDDLYNVGGAGGSNTLISGIAVGGITTATFDVACSATYDGTAIALGGLVFADAESTGGTEYLSAKPDAAATWRVIERERSTGCTYVANADRSVDDTLTFSTSGECWWQGGAHHGPAAVALMEGATGARVTLSTGGGTQAAAFGIWLGTDFGDAPAGYGVAGSFQRPSWSDGVPPVGTTNVFSTTLATPVPPLPRLGATTDSEQNPSASADASGDGSDDDAVTPPATITATVGDTYTLSNVACTGPGSVTGWIDWNHDGSFGAGENSAAADCSGTSVDLTWTVAADAVDATTFLRLRIATVAGQSAVATGMSADGEAEDYQVTVDVSPAAPAVELHKQAGSIVDGDNNGTDAGDTLAYTFQVTDTGNTTLTGLSVTDPVVSGISCPATTLTPGGSTTCTATYTLTQTDLNAGHVASTATATATAPTGPVTATDATDTPIVPPTVPTASVTLHTTAGPATGSAAGQTVPYAFTVTNTGNVMLTHLTVTDPTVTGISCPSTILAPGNSATCTATYTLTQTDVDAGHVASTATVTAAGPSGNTVSASVTTDTTLSPSAAVTLQKKAALAAGSAAGQAVPYSFTVTNTGNLTLTGLAVTDPVVARISCPVTTLAPDSSTACTATYHLTQADVDAGHVASTATATATAPTGAVTATDATDLPVTRKPSVRLHLKADVTGPVKAGDRVVLRYELTNTGNVTLTGLMVTDPQVRPIRCPTTHLAPGASMICTGRSDPVTLADIAAGHVVRSAGVRATAPDLTSTRDAQRLVIPARRAGPGRSGHGGTGGTGGTGGVLAFTGLVGLPGVPIVGAALLVLGALLGLLGRTGPRRSLARHARPRAGRLRGPGDQGE